MAEGSNIDNFNLILQAQISKAQKGECKNVKMTFLSVFLFLILFTEFITKKDMEVEKKKKSSEKKKSRFYK